MHFFKYTYVLIKLLAVSVASIPQVPGSLDVKNQDTCHEPSLYLTKSVESTLNLAPSIKLVQRPKARVSTFVLDQSRAAVRKYRRNARSEHSKAIVAPIQPTQSMSAGIFQDGNDFSYFAEIYLGSQNSMMYMLLDTGASMSWVMGEQCTDPICTSRNRFGAQNSSTFEISNSKFSINYGTGSCSGVIAQDTISFAGMSFKMPFGVASNVSEDFSHFEMYGILGLSITKSKTPSFLDSVVASKSLKSNMFGISLSRTQDGNNTGVINFGSPDTSRFSGELMYYPLAGDGSDWEVDIVSAGFGSTNISLRNVVLFDTGTSYIFAPLEDAKKMHALIPGSKTEDGGFNWQIPCDTKVDLTFQIGSDVHSLPPKIWVGTPTEGSMCQSNLCGTDLNNGNWVFGDSFLKNYYVVYDVDNRRIGLAQVKIPSSTISDPNSSATITPGSKVSSSASNTKSTTQAESNDQKSSSSRRNINRMLILTLLLGFGMCLS